MSNNWYVLTGGPSTGKTTLLAELNKRGFHTIPEAARTVIDEALEKGISVQELRSDEKQFQDDVARMKQKTEAMHDKNSPTFFDRGMHDTVAYLNHYGFITDDWIKSLMQKATYRKVFLLESLPVYDQDYARTEDVAFRDNIHTLLHDAYAQFGMKPVLVPAMSIEDRVEFIMKEVKTEKNA